MTTYRFRPDPVRLRTRHVESAYRGCLYRFSLNVTRMPKCNHTAPQTWRLDSGPEEALYKYQLALSDTRKSM